MSFKVVDFFCGAGGFSEGFHQAGFEIIKAFDIWDPAILTHNKNHSGKNQIAVKENVLDIAELPDEEFELMVPDSEIIIGSPPCIAFSNSNKSGKADKTLGVQLLRAYLKIVARKKAKKNSILKYWILENVANVKEYIEDEYLFELPNVDGVGSLKVKNESSKIYNMKDFGVPSNRKRYICGEFPEPIVTHSNEDAITLREVLASLGDPIDNKQQKIYDINYKVSLKKSDITDHFYLREIPEFEWLKAKRQKTDKGYMGKMAFPENLDKPARTIMATMSSSSRESFILPYKSNRYRYPTIREVATVMSFPIDYRFYGESDTVKYKLVGNAVPPKFSYALAKAIIYKEGLDNNTEFKYKHFDNDGFVNLNGKKYIDKVEKEKKPNAKYKYHIPNLIIGTYRTELINNFDKEKVQWSAEIHKSQGINAQVIIPNNIENELKQFIIDYYLDTINNLIKQINSYENLQTNYRRTLEYRRAHNTVGPDELLIIIKEIIVKDNESINRIFSKYNFNNSQIPDEILFSYILLNLILEGISNDKTNHE